MRKALKLPGLGAAVLALALTVPAPAWAGLCQYFPGLCGGPRPGGGSSQVPEIDPGALRATLAVLVGGVVILLERRRRS